MQVLHSFMPPVSQLTTQQPAGYPTPNPLHTRAPHTTLLSQGPNSPQAPASELTPISRENAKKQGNREAWGVIVAIAVVW